jgi:hypothetical protein
MTKSLSSSSKSEENWQDDILMAGECGEEGLQCCADMDPACKYGSCCVDPNNPENNYCSESCDFGKKDTFCRASNECDEGTTCSEGYCRECGGIDQPCCADKKCGDTLACFRGTCVTCGETGNPCCLSEPYCKLSGDPGLIVPNAKKRSAKPAVPMAMNPVLSSLSATRIISSTSITASAVAASTNPVVRK